MRIFWQPWFLWALVGVNAGGTVWGILWYWEQLVRTPWYFLPVVPDSPLSAAMFGIFILLLIDGREQEPGTVRQWIAWTGVLGCIKYGMWTTVILTQYFMTRGVQPGLQDWMLYLSHGGMALQGLVYGHRLPRRAVAASLAVLWLTVNDFFDYTFLVYPRLPLPGQVAFAGWTNVCLTLLVAAFAFALFRGWKRR